MPSSIKSIPINIIISIIFIILSRHWNPIDARLKDEMKCMASIHPCLHPSQEKISLSLENYKIKWNLLKWSESDSLFFWNCENVEKNSSFHYFEEHVFSRDKIQRTTGFCQYSYCVSAKCSPRNISRFRTIQKSQ